MGPVNIIKFHYDPEATLDRHWHIFIDKKELIDLLEQAVTGPTPRHWHNKNQALLNLDVLRASLNGSAGGELFICANCAASGYRSGGDLALTSFNITHEDEFIMWEIESPGHNNDEYGKTFLRFKFHRPQYISEVTRVLEKNGKSA